MSHIALDKLKAICQPRHRCASPKTFGVPDMAEGGGFEPPAAIAPHSGLNRV